jgi:hypothetical protein
MAWNPSPKVADCREIARKWSGVQPSDWIEQVIIIGIDGQGRTVTATYGRTPGLCKCADAFGKAAIAGISSAILAAEAQIENAPRQLSQDKLGADVGQGGET